MILYPFNIRQKPYESFVINRMVLFPWQAPEKKPFGILLGYYRSFFYRETSLIGVSTKIWCGANGSKRFAGTPWKNIFLKFFGGFNTAPKRRNMLRFNF